VIFSDVVTGAPSLYVRQPGDAPDGDDEATEVDQLAPDPLIGTEVGRYRLTRLIGEGGMGRVYLAIQPAIGSRVAVKILSDQCARNPELLERFFAEARAVNLIRHERIVNIIDLAQLPDGRPLIVMEYIEGETLAAIANDRPVPLGGLVQVMSEVLAALAAAHELGIVHRDLKPDNVRITVEGHAKVLDFGVAKLAPELQQQLSPRTRTGALLGTPQYMAPEQISGTGVIDPRTDLYAAGVVLYELATGRRPFVGETLFDLMRAHLEEPPRPPRALRPELPAALEQVILTALAKRPDERYQSAAAMAEALQQAAIGLPADQWRTLSSRVSSSSRAIGPVTPSSGATTPEALRQTQFAAGPPTLRITRRAGLVVGGVAVVAAAIALVVVLHEGASPPAAAAVPTLAAPPPRTATPPPVEAAPITLRFAVEPASATITLDGRPVQGGELAVAKDRANHALKITAPGYLAREDTVRFDESQRLTIQLKRAPSAAPRPEPPRPELPRADRIDSHSPYD